MVKENPLNDIKFNEFWSHVAMEEATKNTRKHMDGNNNRSTFLKPNFKKKSILPKVQKKENTKNDPFNVFYKPTRITLIRKQLTEERLKNMTKK